MLLLFVEDDEASIGPARKAISENYEDITIQICDFADCQSHLELHWPDLLVLDLFQGEPGIDLAGKDTYQALWENKFCPLIIYSAMPNALDTPEHPFVKRVQKGKDSPRELCAAIGDLKPHAQAVRQAENDLRKQFSFALREIAPYAFEAYADTVERDEVLKRCGRRRLASTWDELVICGSPLKSWEQYIFPPVTADVLLGDILRREGDEWSEATSFSVVLTPSCDLVVSGGRRPKVENVLVANCIGVKEGRGKLSLSSNDKKSDLKKRVLTQGFFQKLIPFPGLKNRIPPMWADLKNLDLIPITNIGERKEFIRIASLDNPFRELIAWAYLQTSCRPGIPDRDWDSWCDEILED